MKYTARIQSTCVSNPYNLVRDFTNKTEAYQSIFSSLEAFRTLMREGDVLNVVVRHDGYTISLPNGVWKAWVDEAQ